MNPYHVFFSRLSNLLRMRIIESLNKSDKSVTELCNELGVEQSKLSHALRSLSLCKIVKFRKEGRNRVYSLNKETVVPILRLIDKHEKKFCGFCRRK